MSMQEPADLAVLERRKAELLDLKAKYTVGVVAPNGVVTEHHCPPPTDDSDAGQEHGDELVRWVNGEAQVVKRYAQRGYVLLSAIAKEDGQPETFDLWKKAITARIKGYPLRGDTSKLFSKSVIERRERFKAGSVATEGQAFDLEKGEVVDDPQAQREKLAKRLEEVGVGNPLTEPEPEPDSKPKGRGKAASR